MKTSPKYLFFVICLSYSMIIQTTFGAPDTITTSQILRDGETMVSSDGVFELGFFRPGNSTNRYVGLWHKMIKERKILWVANRNAPLTSESGVLKVINPGLLVILNVTNGTVWSSNASRSVRNPVAQLLDSGNLVVRDENDLRPENFLWQSFDHPTDTSIPGIKFGRNLVTGAENYFLSWKSNDDPSPGEFNYHLDPTGYPQIIMKYSTVVLHRYGPWNGINFGGIPNETDNPMYRLKFVMNEEEVYYWEENIDKSFISIVVINQSGNAQRLAWVDPSQKWVEYINLPADACDNYNICGAYGICNIVDSPLCKCLNRFEPKDPEGWIRADWENGCIRRSNLSCQGDVFLKYSGIKLPDARFSSNNPSMTTLEECRAECIKNCSCMAYTQLDIKKGNGCLFWHEDLIDIRMISNGRDIYIRMASSESENVADSEANKRETILIASLASVVGVLLVGLSLFLYIKKRSSDTTEGRYHGSQEKNSEVPLFDLSIILKATNNFSDDNKLGEGGFGPVYKGMLEEAQEIAVKRLSKDSMQGLDEFKNEIIFISKLQHRNLVRLLGGCIQGNENMLIYEHMPNKSLDIILFDETKSMLLDWKKRFHIINGIARGLLYLHQDSRLRIIHRDLKASNILLDSDMNPKISDFGIARSFGGNETEAKTRQVVGTYGYMSPEYAIDGLFSVKSDVFSFGVLVLEIVSGMRNRKFSHSSHNLNLLGHAWTLYKEGRSLELVDPHLTETFYFSEMLRTIHVGLLCVQQNPEDRPSMCNVVLMLSNEGVFPQARHPGFFTQREVLSDQSLNSTNAANSINEITITMPDAR